MQWLCLRPNERLTIASRDWIGHRCSLPGNTAAHKALTTPWVCTMLGSAPALSRASTAWEMNKHWVRALHQKLHGSSTVYSSDHRCDYFEWVWNQWHTCGLEPLTLPRRDILTSAPSSPSCKITVTKRTRETDVIWKSWSHRNNTPVHCHVWLPATKVSVRCRGGEYWPDVSAAASQPRRHSTKHRSCSHVYFIMF